MLLYAVRRAPQEGCIAIDGVPLTDIHLQNLAPEDPVFLTPSPPSKASLLFLFQFCYRPPPKKKASFKFLLLICTYQYFLFVYLCYYMPCVVLHRKDAS